MTRAEQVQALEVTHLVEQIKPILAGKPHVIQGAVLADCLAIWLASMMPKEAREIALKLHLEKVAELVIINANILGTEP
jgi:predicted Abi (CAAX) family protease